MVNDADIYYFITLPASPRISGIIELAGILLAKSRAERIYK